MKKQLVVIGGGAAGFFCAVNAARMHPHLSVWLLEKTGNLLSKVKVSGGGRCNVTHDLRDITEMSKRYPRGQHFVKKAFHQFFTTDTIQWFSERGVQLKTEADGRMFPVTDSSQAIISCLLQEADQYAVRIQLHAEVKNIQPLHHSFQLTLADDTVIPADYICIACGGYPKSFMFQWLKDLGHSIEEPVPSLFTFNLPGKNADERHHPITKLMGVSVDAVSIKIIGSKLEEKGPVLITHWGLSGPAVLRLSAWGARELKEKQYHFQVMINWLPGYRQEQWKEKFQQLRLSLATQKLVNKNPFGLPARLWEFLVLQSGIPEQMRWADLPSKNQHILLQNLTAYLLEVKGKTTFKEEFVTAGGIKLSEVDPNTMMSRKIPHLFFAGEILDVDGITGGFNFQHAWTSAYIAAAHINL